MNLAAELKNNNFRILSITFLINLAFLIKLGNCNEVVGCNGFIQSHANLDFSKVEIKLVTKQGALKESITCAPSNGYYFLPIYDKGEYQLRISPPPGWSFEREFFEFNFDGKSDICSQGDVNFIFKGFGITGKVNIAGHQIGGARGVTIELRSEDEKDIRRTETDLNGIFSFTPVVPGKYTIRAKHVSWYLGKSEYDVLVKSGNTELPENSLVVSGFKVNGKFLNIGQSNEFIKIKMFKSNKEIQSSSIDKSGQYVFENVPTGEYVLKPFVIDSNLKLSIGPEEISIKIERDNLEVHKSFQITDFRVSGRILLASGVKVGVSKAVIKLNGKFITETLKDGSFSLNNIQPGKYSLQVEAENVKFNEQDIEISLTNPKIPDVFVSEFKVCGQVISEKSYVLGITKFGSTFHNTTSSKGVSGEWCVFLPGGKYSVEVLTTDADKSNGIQFFPLKQTIVVNNSPVSGIIFSQLRATLTGDVKCLPDASSNCKNIEITLQSLDSTGQNSGQTLKTLAENGKFSFAEILPGPYEISIPQSNLCFESTKHFLNINSAHAEASFVQKGYEISLISSHRTELSYKHKTDQNGTPVFKSKLETIKLMSGVNLICVDKSGEYSFTLDGCHLYSKSDLPKSFNTGDPSPIVLTAIAHKIGIRVLSPENNQDTMKLLIETKSSGKIDEVIPNFEEHKVDGYNSYRYNTYLKPEEKIIITPQSNIMLFKPDVKELVGGNDCLDVAFNFLAIKGLIIQGKIVPPLRNAKIILKFPNDPDIPEQEALSNWGGDFKFKPIDQSLHFTLEAEKESYIFSDYNKVKNIFTAHKLCEIIATVKDEAGNKLGGVLLSLSGAESYRKNLITAEDGTIKFHSLSPSPNYYLRPMMKEYKFEPNSKIIDVKDGQTVRVELIGKRVAYSVFGVITSLNGEPFPNVLVEAISDENCMHHQEESSSEANGQYRIRGLQPDCLYTVRPKEDPIANPNVERSIPYKRTIKITTNDTHNINLIAISPINFVDVIVRIHTASNHFYKTLRLQMYRKGNADSPIYSQKVEQPLNPKARLNPGIMVFLPRIQLDGKTYFVELKTTLSDKIYKYKLPVEQFVANTSSIYVELNFEYEIRTSESELNQNSISALLLLALVAIAFFKQDLAMDTLNFVWTFVQDQINAKITNSKKKETRNIPEQAINYKEIEQIAEGINSIKKKKAKKA